MQHIPVLVPEVVEGLALTPDAVVVDATLGGGGHTQAIASVLDQNGKIIAFDVDPVALADAQVWHQQLTPEVVLVNKNFATLKESLHQLGLETVNGILADLGWRMEQFSQGGRGFSFMVDEPLLMTFGEPNQYTCTAADILNEWEVEQIANVLFGYGEERYAKRIAHAVVQARQKARIETSGQLAALVADAVPKKYVYSKVHPATKTFQALRIAVNDELSILESFLEQALSSLAVGGRLAIISFHSLEDRIVKHTFREWAKTGRAKLITKRPISASPEETRRNSRARSAKLRIIELS